MHHSSSTRLVTRGGLCLSCHYVGVVVARPPRGPFVPVRIVRPGGLLSIMGGCPRGGCRSLRLASFPASCCQRHRVFKPPSEAPGGGCRQSRGFLWAVPVLHCDQTPRLLAGESCGVKATARFGVRTERDPRSRRYGLGDVCLPLSPSHWDLWGVSTRSRGSTGHNCTKRRGDGLVQDGLDGAAASGGFAGLGAVWR